MRIRTSLIVLALLSARSVSGQPPELVTFRVRPQRSRLVVHLFKAGLGSRFAHDHVIAARAIDGTIQVDPTHPETARIQVTAFTDGLEADAPELRRAYSMPAISDKDRREITASMRSPGQLDTARYRTITFRSAQVTPAGAGRFEVLGALTIHGITRSVRLTVDAHLSGHVLEGRGRLTFHQSDFGYKPYSAMLGLVKVRDEAVMDLDLVGSSAER